jgi:hypothetical protein
MMNEQEVMGAVTSLCSVGVIKPAQLSELLLSSVADPNNSDCKLLSQQIQLRTKAYSSTSKHVQQTKT